MTAPAGALPESPDIAQDMARVNRICRHPLFRKCLQDILEDERDRIYCGHDIRHLMDTARLMLIFAKEDAGISGKEAGLSGEEADSSGQTEPALAREMIYAAALLHDIGRSRQYRQNIPHDQASAALAGQILPECGFTAQEISLITEAILSHRGSREKARSPLGRLLYLADKKSRLCLFCPAEKTCDWPAEKKNLQLSY